METRELTPLEALSYLDDIAHGRKMKYDPHVLKRIVEKELKRLDKIDELFEEIDIDENDLPIWFEMQKQDGKILEELEKAFDALSKENEKVMKELSKEIEKNRVLKIIYDAPSILQQLFELGQLDKKTTQRYMWGTITDSRVQKIKEFFADGKRDQSK